MAHQATYLANDALSGESDTSEDSASEILSDPALDDGLGLIVGSEGIVDTKAFDDGEHIA